MLIQKANAYVKPAVPEVVCNHVSLRYVQLEIKDDGSVELKIRPKPCDESGMAVELPEGEEVAIVTATIAADVAAPMLQAALSAVQSASPEEI